MVKTNEKKASRTIKLLGSSSLINDFASEMITPILPFYISSLGGTGLAVGALSGLREGLSSLFKILGGWASDRTGKRKKFIFLGYLISIVSRFFLLLAASWQMILGLVSFERFGKLRDPPRDAIIAESTKKRGKWFGFHQMMDSAGGVLGTIFVIILFWKLNLEFKSIILIAAIVSAFSIIPLFFVKEPKSKSINKNLFQGIKSLSPKLKYLVFVSAVFTLGNFGLYMFLLLLAKQVFENALAPFILYALFTFAFALLVTYFGSLSDKIGRKKVLFFGYFLFLIVSLSLVFFLSPLSIIAAFLLYGVVMAMTMSNHKAFVSDLSGEMKGTALGFYYFVTGLVNIPAGIIAGFLWDKNPTFMFIYISCVTLISIILLLTIKEKKLL